MRVRVEGVNCNVQDSVLGPGRFFVLGIYRVTSLIRNSPPPRATIGPQG